MRLTVIDVIRFKVDVFVGVDRVHVRRIHVATVLVGIRSVLLLMLLVHLHPMRGLFVCVKMEPN